MTLVNGRDVAHIVLSTHRDATLHESCVQTTRARGHVLGATTSCMASGQWNSPALRTPNASAPRHRRCMVISPMVRLSGIHLRAYLGGFPTVGAALLVLVLAHGASADDGAGMRVYRDPATGEFTAPPPSAAVVPDAAGSAAALGSAPPALVEEPGSSAAGGVTIDLRGRFHSEESATIDEAGKIHTRCHTDADGGTTP